MATEFRTEFDFGTRVTVDGDASIIGIITAFKYMWPGEPLVEISYFHNGEQKFALIEESRLARHPSETPRPEH